MIERKPCYDDKSGLERDVLLPIYFALEPNKESKILANLMLTKYEYIQSEEDKKNKKEKKPEPPTDPKPQISEDDEK